MAGRFKRARSKQLHEADSHERARLICAVLIGRQFFSKGQQI
jgi:hypothetical protein